MTNSPRHQFVAVLLAALLTTSAAQSRATDRPEIVVAQSSGPSASRERIVVCGVLPDIVASSVTIDAVRKTVTPEGDTFYGIKASGWVTNSGAIDFNDETETALLRLVARMAYGEPVQLVTSPIRSVPVGAYVHFESVGDFKLDDLTIDQLAQVNLELTLDLTDPALAMDDNPANDDCDPDNNNLRIEAAEFRSVLTNLYDIEFAGFAAEGAGALEVAGGPRDDDIQPGLPIAGNFGGSLELGPSDLGFEDADPTFGTFTLTNPLIPNPFDLFVFVGDLQVDVGTLTDGACPGYVAAVADLRLTYEAIGNYLIFTVSGFDGATLVVTTPAGEVFCGAAGQVGFEDADPGTYDLRVGRIGDGYAGATITITEGNLTGNASPE